ncbi:MAG: HIT family protein, partial [Lentisphaeria bacterium]
NKVYEDEKVLAFMDIAPINPGHILIIPKVHHVSITELPADYLAAMMQVAPSLGQAASREIDGDGFNLHLSNGTCAGQIVPHVHLHVIPRCATDGFSWGHRTMAYESDEVRALLAEKIAQRIDK